MFTNNSLIAIDIGSAFIKIMEASGGPKTIHKMGIEKVPEGAIHSGEIQNQEALIQALKAVCRKTRIKTSAQTSVNLSSESMIIKRIRVDGKEDEIGEVVYYEAEQHFEHNLNDLYFDYHILGPNPDAGHDVLLVGAKKSAVEKLITIVKAAGFKVGFIECDVFSLCNSFEYNYGNAPGLTVLLNLGASSTQATLLGDGQYLYTRNIPIGGNHFTLKLSEALALPFASAETIKLNSSQQGLDAGIKDAITEVAESFISEFQLTLDYFFRSDTGEKYETINKVFISGGASQTPLLAPMISEANNVSVESFNPFAKFIVPPPLFQQASINSALYGVVSGLTLRKLEELRDVA